VPGYFVSDLELLEAQTRKALFHVERHASGAGYIVPRLERSNMATREPSFHVERRS
jgi:hypothetical protein